MLKRDITATFGGTVLSTILGLGVGIVMARALGRDGRGMLALALLLPMIIDKFALMGQDLVNSTFAGTHKEQRSSLFFHGIIFTIAGGALTVLCICAFYFWLPISRGRFGELSNEIVILTCFYAPVTLLNSMLAALVRGVGRVVLAAGYMVILSAVNLVLAVVMLWWLRMGLMAAVGISVVVPLIGIGLNIWALRDYATLRPSAFSWPLMRKSLSFGGLISLSTLAGFLIYRLDQGMLGYMVTEGEVGLYVVAVGLAERLRMLPSAISTAFLPRLANEVESRQGQVPMVFRQTLLVSLFAMGVAGVFGIPAIHLLYGAEFTGSIVPFLILLPGIAALGGASILAADLMVRKKVGYSVRTSYSMLIINVVLNLVLIPVIGIRGAAVASLISYIGATVLWIIYYCRESGNGVGDLRPRWADVGAIQSGLLKMWRQVLGRYYKMSPVAPAADIGSKGERE